LWEQFHNQICDDFRHQLQVQQGLEDPSEHEVHDYIYFIINQNLRNDYNTSLHNRRGMPQFV
jgi:hypothetical protein